jgi:predicted nucleic acid-binding protein
VIAPDTSVLVAGFATWHEAHESAASALNRGAHLVAHNVTGGAAYDALVGLTAKVAGATLLTRDRRAVRTYELLDVDYELVP